MKRIISYLKEIFKDLDKTQKILMFIFLIITMVALSFWVIRFWYPVSILYPSVFNVLQLIMLVIINQYNKKLQIKMIKDNN